MIDDIVALLRLFGPLVPDAETNAWVTELAADRSRWPDAHEMFSRVRERTLAAISNKDRGRQAQYGFEEICLKSIYNETATNAPFDSDSPHWISKCAIGLARVLGLPEQSVIDIIAPRHRPTK
jgi:hypothetical protein